MTQPSAPVLFQRPSTLFTAIILCALIVFFSLGVWQVQRLLWKENLIATIQKSVQLPPADFFETVRSLKLPAPLSYRTIVPSAFRDVSLNGTFLTDKFIFFVDRSPNGVPGVHVFMAFQPNNETSENEPASAVLVNRGWIPFDVRRHGGWQTFLQNKETTDFTAKIRFYRELSWIRNLILPLNTPQTNTFFRLNVAEIEQQLQIPINDQTYLVEELPPSMERPYPIAGPWVRNIPNNHLVYAVTWFSLVVVLMGMWIFYGIHLAKQPTKNDH